MPNVNNISIQLPFSGFYESIHDQYIDNFIEYEICYFEDEVGLTGEKLDKLKDNLYMMDYAPIRKAICKHYIDAYNQVFYDEFNIHLDLNFDSLVSPQFYNFETDKLFCTVEQDKFNKVIALLNDDEIQSKLRDRYKNRSGFIVFESTIEAINNKDYSLFSADLFEMLLDESKVIDNYQYTDNISEIISNSAVYEEVK